MIRPRNHSRLRGARRLWAWGAGLTMFMVVHASAVAQSTADDARRILKAMSDYLAQQKVIQLTLDSDIEVITPELQKIQFSSSGSVLLQRPDRLRASRSSGYSKVDLAFDGTTFTLYGENIKAYTRLEAPGSVDQLIDRLRDQYGIAAPGADLLASDVYATLIADVIDAKHIGRGIVDGVECEHLAFRNTDTDWQIWIEPGARPIPHKYVITSKTLTGAPQYTVRVKDWKTNVEPGAEAFSVPIPADTRKVAIGELSGVDEVPLGVAPGNRQ